MLTSRYCNMDFPDTHVDFWPFKHFWLICGLWCGGLNAWLYNQITPPDSDQVETLSQAEIRRFSRNLLIAILAPCLALWLLQLSIGQASTPFFTEWPDPQRLMANSLLVVCWSLLLWWVWVGTGATQLSRIQRLYRPDMPRFLSSPTAYKVTTTLSVLVGVLSLIVPM